MYKVTSTPIDSKKEKTVEVNFSKNELQIDQENYDWDILELKEGTYHILQGGKSYTVEVLSADYEKKEFQIQINKRIYVVNAKDKMDLLLESLGMENLTSVQVNDIKAPMPGLVLEVLVSPEQEVQEGESLLILEAMKMENVIKSPITGIIKAIHAEKGKNVEKNFVMIEFA